MLCPAAARQYPGRCYCWAHARAFDSRGLSRGGELITAINDRREAIGDPRRDKPRQTDQQTRMRFRRQAQPGYRPIDGIDISPAMIELAKAKGVYRQLLELTEELLRRNHAQTTVKAVLGRNLIRLAAQLWG